MPYLHARKVNVNSKGREDEVRDKKVRENKVRINKVRKNKVRKKVRSFEMKLGIMGIGYCVH